MTQATPRPSDRLRAWRRSSRSIQAQRRSSIPAAARRSCWSVSRSSSRRRVSSRDRASKPSLDPADHAAEVVAQPAGHRAEARWLDPRRPPGLGQDPALGRGRRLARGARRRGRDVELDRRPGRAREVDVAGDHRVGRQAVGDPPLGQHADERAATSRGASRPDAASRSRGRTRPRPSGARGRPPPGRRRTGRGSGSGGWGIPGAMIVTTASLARDRSAAHPDDRHEDRVALASLLAAE